MSKIDIPRLEEEFAPVAADVGCELVAVEFRSGRLVVFLDHPDGVTLEHCQTISRELSALLDVSDWGPGRYILEVSSPGLDRKLYRPADYARYEGETVRVTWIDPNDHRKQTVVGEMTAFHGDAEPTENAASDASITLVASENEKQYNIALKDVQSARLAPQF